MAVLRSLYVCQTRIRHRLGNSFSKLALEANKIVPEGLLFMPESMTSPKADVNTYFNDIEIW